MWIETVRDAEAIGNFQPLGRADLFEPRILVARAGEARLAKAKPLTGQVALVTGGAGAIGAATARSSPRKARMSSSSIIDAAKAEEVAKAAGNNSIGVGCDVTDPAAVAAAFDCARSRIYRRARHRRLERRRRLRGRDRRRSTTPFCGRVSSSISSPIRRVAQNAVRIMQAARHRRRAVCSTPSNRRSIPAPISAPTACPRQRPCSCRGNTRSNTAPTHPLQRRQRRPYPLGLLD